MQEIIDKSGKVLEEIKEAEKIDSVKDGIRTFTAACGGAFTLYCC